MNKQEQLIVRAVEDSKIKFSTPSSIVPDLIHKGIFDEAGNPTVDLVEAVTEYAKWNPESVSDRRTLPRTAVVKSKEDLKTITDKTRYIDTFGAEAFEKLPLRESKPTGVPRSLEEFRALPISEKTKLISERGNSWLESLPSTQRQEHAARKLRGGI